MVTLTIEPNPVIVPLHFLANVPPLLEDVICEGLVPPHLFERLIRLGACWCIDLSCATENEEVSWTFEDTKAQCIKALKEGKTVLFENVPLIDESDVDHELRRFLDQYKEVLFVAEITDMFLILDCSTKDVRKFWSKVT